MKVALIGLPQSGKSLVLSAISGKEAAAVGANSIAEAVVPVPDERLDFLTGMYQPKKTVHATVDCLDVPGLSFTDEASRAAARRQIAEIKSIDMFVMVIRDFADETVPPYRSTVDALRDVNELQTEFLLADLELVSVRLERLEKQLQKSSKTAEQDKAELAIQRKLQAVLEENRPARTAQLEEKELELIRSLGLLTLKPMMVLVNVGEGDLTKEYNLSSIVDSSVPICSLCAKLEKELSQLDEESRKDFMADLGITQPASAKFVNNCYSALGLISFLTVGPDEVRAWPIRRNSTALDAAGKIHSDIKRGFIRAETMAYSELKDLGSEKAMRAAGRMRLEGKTYVVQDGDIINFRFNV